MFLVLQIVPVSVINDGKIFDTYALIDSGSTGTYVLGHITKALNLKPSENFDSDVQFLSISRSIIVSFTPFLLAPYADYESVRSHTLFACSQRLLHPHHQLPPSTHALERIRSASNCPAGVRKNRRGGPLPVNSRTQMRKNLSRCHQVFFASQSPSPEIQPSIDVLENYWTIEKAGCDPAIDKKRSLEEKETLRILNKTCHHNGERYRIGLPWKSSATLPKNYFAAVNQAGSLKKRRRDNPIVLQIDKETVTKDLALYYVETVIKHPPHDKSGICEHTLLKIQDARKNSSRRECSLKIQGMFSKLHSDWT